MSITGSHTRNVRNVWKAIRYTSLMITLMSGVFLLAALVICETAGAVSPGMNAYKIWILPVLSILTFVVFLAGRYLYQQQLMKARESSAGLIAKLEYYRMGILRYLALTEGLVILGAILFLCTADFSYLVFSAVLVGFMGAMLPRKSKIPALLQLDSLQTAEINN